MGVHNYSGRSEKSTTWLSAAFLFLLITIGCTPSSAGMNSAASTPVPMTILTKTLSTTTDATIQIDGTRSRSEHRAASEAASNEGLDAGKPTDDDTGNTEVAWEPPDPPTVVVNKDESTFMKKALSMIPEGASIFEFTNWYKLKKHFGVPYLTSQYDEDERNWFTNKVISSNLQAAMFDHYTFFRQAELWGYDHNDLVWEARAVNDFLTDSISVMRLQENVDFNVLSELLIEKGFSIEEYDGVQIFMFPLVTKADWHNQSPLEMHNAALLEEERIVVLSPNPEQVRQVVDTYKSNSGSLYDNGRIRRVAFHLANLFAAEIHLGTDTCEKYGSAMDEGAATGSPSLKGESINSQLEKWPVKPYEVLGIGHTIFEDVQTDLVILHYDEFRTASMDFDNRKNLFFFGQSTSPEKVGVNYSAQFYLEDAELDDALMVFQLSPTPGLIGERQGWAQTILGWTRHYDGLFAACQVEMIEGLDLAK